jgi:hypothetical protein
MVFLPLLCSRDNLFIFKQYGYFLKQYILLYGSNLFIFNFQINLLYNLMLHIGYIHSYKPYRYGHTRHLTSLIHSLQT